MRRFAHFVAILLLLTTAAPVLACVTGSRMSHEERACCQAMHGQCGEMAKMGCCQTELRTDQSPQIATAVPAIGFQPVLVDRPVVRVFAAPVIASALLELPEDYFPPGLSIAKSTVLRI
jgi:hypothetical protein